ncbi:MAG: FAD-dependent oxidoreductase [Clostridia bacterium]|nr:FAD-dependent oxidoreductase [Clostridia bacterium]
MMNESYQIAVIGGGIAGQAAALTAKSLRLKLLWLGEGYGKADSAEYVRNYPAFTGNGAALAEALEKQRAAEGLVLTFARVDGVYKSADGFLLTAGKRTFSAQTVVLATGVEASGVIAGEREFLGRGVSYCAVCDGALYRGKEIAVVLGNAKFSDEVEYLAGFASTVYCVCRGFEGNFRAKNIKTVKDTPLAVIGEQRVSGLKLSQSELTVDGVFFLKNSAPPEALVGGLETDGAFVRVTRDCATNLKGLFAAGDITGTPYQFAKAAGEGLVAVYSARAYLNTLDKKNGE